MSLCTALGEGVPVEGICVLVTGGRDYCRCARVWRALDLIDAGTHIGCILQGECSTGMDLYARNWATARGRPCPNTFRADWDAAEKLTGRREAGGPIRNKKMVDTRPDLCLVGPGGKGTSSCARLARAAGIKIVTLEEMLAT